MAVRIEFSAITTGFAKAKTKVAQFANSAKSQLGKAFSGIKKKGLMDGILGGGAAGPVAMALAAVTASLAGIVRGFQVAFRIASSLADTLDQVAKSARRTNIEFEQFQKLSFAAELTGATSENVERAVRTFQQRMLDVQMMPTGTTARIMERLGLDFTRDLKDLKTGDRILKLAQELNKVDIKERAGIAQKLFGRGGSQLLPMFAALKEANQIFNNMDLSISKDSLVAGEEFKDQLTIINRQLTAFSANSGLMEGFISIFKTLNVALSKTRDLFTQINEKMNGLLGNIPGFLKKFLEMRNIMSLGPIGAIQNFVLGTAGEQIKKMAQEGEKLMPARSEQPGGIFSPDFSQTAASRFAARSSAFNNMGGFMTAGMRAVGLNDPVVTELQRQTMTLKEMLDIFSNMTAEDWNIALNGSTTSGIGSGTVMFTGGKQ